MGKRFRPEFPMNAPEECGYSEGGMVCPSCGAPFETETDESEETEAESFSRALLRRHGGGSGLKWYAANGGMVPRRVC